MGQLLLIADPRPLDERLGRKFFRQTPRRPGVYLMKDAAGHVLYVGKAKNLRQRLRNYRTANPDRMPRRHLRMVREVSRIEFAFCPNESAALRRESRLLRSLKPKFNRAGVWPAKTRFLAWRWAGPLLEFTATELPAAGWRRYGPLGGAARPLHRTLSCLLWVALNPDRAVADLPAGWLQGRFPETVLIQCGKSIEQVAALLDGFFGPAPDDALLWLGSRYSERTQPFERAFIQSQLEPVQEFHAKRLRQDDAAQQLALL